MKVSIQPGAINGHVAIPPSKSHSQRVLAAALLHNGETLVNNLGVSEDELAALGIIKHLGASVTQLTNAAQAQTVIRSVGRIVPLANHISCGESGLATRLFAPIAATSSAPLRLEGHGSLLRRNLIAISQTLAQFGVHVEMHNGHLPCTISGPLRAANTHIDAAGSSQLVSGLLIALAATVDQPVTLQVANVVSTPYIAMTLDVLRSFGRPIEHENFTRFNIDPARFLPQHSVHTTIEADWSSASCLLVAGAIAGSITVDGLSLTSAQADKEVMRALRDAGANIKIEDGKITVSRSRLQAFDFDAAHCPDLFPALAALASFCYGESSISGVHRLFEKESNRVESITEMLWQFGIPFSVMDDTLYITGRDKARYTHMPSYNDHRIVMASAVCALRSRGEVTIHGVEAVNKSYPKFFEDLGSCGMQYIIA